MNDALTPIRYSVQGGEATGTTMESSHDTLLFEKHRNFLVNAAGIGIYAHGRVHQQSQNAIFVSDLVHSRGHKQTSDILLMEEQALDSCGEPLTVRSSLGGLRAVEMLPAMSTANGEGDLIAYYDGGVVSFETQSAPRETRYDGDGKQLISKGWDSRRLVNHLLNRISAVGRYAVALFPRDHWFRSTFGLHFLKLSVGEGSLKTEQINKLSTDVEPILDADDPALLGGVACGFWLHGNRAFATTGLVEDKCFSATPFGRGFVSWNQAVTFTEDQTPRPAWEGLWTFDHGIAGVHWLGDIGIRPDASSFGFLASGADEKVFFATIDKDARKDWRDGEWIDIEWSLETGRFHAGTIDRTKVLKGGSFEAVLAAGTKVRALVRTDKNDSWTLWKEFTSAFNDPVRLMLVLENLGSPPRGSEEGTWFQVRVEGIGHAEVRSIDLELADGNLKAGRHGCAVTGAPEKDFFETNSSAPDTRWKLD